MADKEAVEGLVSNQGVQKNLFETIGNTLGASKGMDEEQEVAKGARENMRLYEIILSESELVSHGTKYKQNTEQFNFTLMKMSQDKKGVLSD
jgi:hypothetical protein